MLYQDLWYKGKLVEKGERDCESRYEVIKNLAAKYKRPFTVLDIGANQGYFTVRLAEEFPHCTVIAIEPNKAYDLKNRLSYLDNVIVLEKVISVEELKQLSRCEWFGLVICTSVLHCIDNFTPFKDILNVVKQLGPHIVLELPTEKLSLGTRHDEMMRLIDSLGEPVLQVPSHVDLTVTRPLFVVKGNPPQTNRCSRFGTDYVAKKKLKMNFSKAEVTFVNKNITRAWIPGINLWTYLQLDGIYPSRQTLAQMIKDADWDKHHDIVPWNVVLSGNKVSVIDKNDPGHPEEAPLTNVDKIVDFVLSGEKQYNQE